MSKASVQKIARARLFPLIVAGFIVVLGVGTTGLGQAGAYVSAAGTAPDAADLIVVLGGGRGTRVDRAKQLFDSGHAEIILVTGLNTKSAGSAHTIADKRVRYLLDRGVPAAAIRFDYRSANSYEEAHNTRAFMEEQGLHRALVVSDPPHMRRLAWVWERVFASSNAQVTLVPSRPHWWNAEHWWNNLESAGFVVSELIKIAYYHVRYGETQSA